MSLQSGRITVQKVDELGAVLLPMTRAFPDVTREDLRHTREWYTEGSTGDDPATAIVGVPFHSFVLKVEGKNILIDTCNGNHKTRSDATPWNNDLNLPYLENLEAVGLAPEDIDVVLCTHLHFDHVGWNTRLENGRWVPTFPKARYLFTRADYEFFDKNHEEPLHLASFEDSILPVVEHGLADLVETDHVVEHEIGNGVWLEGTPGHSPGSCVVHAKRGGDQLVFSGDTFHHPLELTRPDILFFGDLDHGLAAATRRKMFERYADTSTLFLPAHFGGASAGRIQRHRHGFKFDYLDPATFKAT
ncbi:MAG: MBL fold metallo-hydrolase [Rhizomicrobium sp.]